MVQRLLRRPAIDGSLESEEIRRCWTRGCGGRDSRRGRRRRLLLRWSARPARLLSGRTGFLQRLEVDERKIVGENRGEFVRLGLREIALRLDDEEARRQPHFKPLALG